MGGPIAVAGRPREFDPDAALERAMRVFWRQGYEGSSLSDLTRAMGISSPSLYAAFGSKERLFYRAVDRYAAGPAGYVLRALEAPTAREVAKRLLDGAIELYTARGHPGGCLGVHGALACGPGAAPVRRAARSAPSVAACAGPGTPATCRPTRTPPGSRGI